MKILLATVSIIVVFTVDGQNFRNEPGEQDSTIDKAELLTEELAMAESYHNLHSGPETRVYDVDDNIFGGNISFADGHDSKNANAGQLVKNTNSLVDGEYQDNADKTNNWQEEKKQIERKGNKTICKAKTPCDLLGGFCVTNSTLCSGRLVPQGCKGPNCQCCVPDIIGAKFENLEKKLQLLKSNISLKLNDMNSNLNSKLDDMNSNIISNLSNMNSNLISKLNDINSNINSNLSNLDSNLNTKLNTMNSGLLSKLSSLVRGCPGGYFKLSASNQCFKFFTDTARTWTAAKSKCQSEGLVLPKPYNAVELRSYLVTKYGSKYAWLDGQMTSSVMKWNRDGTTISSSSSSWYPGHPGSRTSTSYCLLLQSNASQMKSYPTKIYYSEKCTQTYPYALCELL